MKRPTKELSALIAEVFQCKHWAEVLGENILSSLRKRGAKEGHIIVYTKHFVYYNTLKGYTLMSIWYTKAGEWRYLYRERSGAKQEEEVTA